MCYFPAQHCALKGCAMPRIACLHTAQSNVAVFDAALAAVASTGVSLHHEVRADLLAAAELEGGLTRQIVQQTAEALRGLSEGADVVLLTCSTLGPAAEIAADDASIPILRVDAALAAEAVKNGGSVAVLCAVETTVEPTRWQFEAAAQVTGAEVCESGSGPVGSVQGWRPGSLLGDGRRSRGGRHAGRRDARCTGASFDGGGQQPVTCCPTAPYQPDRWPYGSRQSRRHRHIRL